MAPLTFEGYCDSEFVEAWFAQELSPVLRAGQVVILDNAWFHRHEVLPALPGRCGLHPSATPLTQRMPGSPDLNQIESLWNTLKRKIELDANSYPSFHHKVDDAFL